MREANDISTRIGAVPLVEQVADLARRARIALGSVAADDDDPFAQYGLTAREREILARVAAGDSNPQIATALFISAKTVSVHVSNILTKLGVSSRGQAAALAHQLGIAREPDGTVATIRRQMRCRVGNRLATRGPETASDG